MKFLLMILIVLVSLFFIQSCYGQNLATISGMLTDTDGTPWINATWTARAVSPSSPPVYLNGQPVTAVSGQLSATATFSGAIPRTSQIVPFGTTLTFTICSVTSAPCLVIPSVVVTPASIDLGALLSPRTTAPRIAAAPLVYAYTTTEILNPVNGSGYVNTTSNLNFLFVGGAWVSIGNPPPSSLLSLPNTWTALNTFQGGASINHIFTPSFCTANITPYACGSNSTGFISLPDGVGGGQINSTAIGPNSQIFLTEDSGLSTALGVTCLSSPVHTPILGTRGAGFITFGVPTAPSGGSACFSFLVIN